MNIKGALSIVGCSILLTGCTAVNSSLDNFDQSFTAPISSVWFSAPTSQLAVYYADTVDERVVGLASIAVLEPNHGMLFSYTAETPSQPNFWMKGVEYPIDIIWIWQGKVSGITANVQPELPATELADYMLYSAPGLVEWVVEAPAGYAADHSIAVGDSFHYSLPK